MGALIPRWRKKVTTVEQLENIDKEVVRLETTKKNNVASQRKIIGSLLIYSVFIYFIGAVIFYLYYMPESLADKVLYSTPLLIFPILIYLIKRLLKWYFIKRIQRNDFALEELQNKKIEILDTVKEKETYKVAKEILDRFDPERQKSPMPVPTPAAPARAPDGQELRRRGPGGGITPVATVNPISSDANPATAPTPVAMVAPQTPRPHPSHLRNGTLMAPGPPMPRPILPRERGAAERVLEMVLGDGPQNRYALICEECKSHNGMAMREEFEYLSFRCCYCYHLNNSKKQKPRAPRINFSPHPSPRHSLKLSKEDVAERLQTAKDFDEHDSPRKTNMKVQGWLKHSPVKAKHSPYQL